MCHLVRCQSVHAKCVSTRGIVFRLCVCVRVCVCVCVPFPPPPCSLPSILPVPNKSYGFCGRLAPCLPTCGCPCGGDTKTEQPHMQSSQPAESKCTILYRLLGEIWNAELGNAATRCYVPGTKKTTSNLHAAIDDMDMDMDMGIEGRIS